MSTFDDLLDLGDDPQGNNNQSADPFGDLNQPAGNSSGNLLDFGFDEQISTQNGPSGKVNLEANTNPLYEFSNSQDIMACEPSNPLYELDSEPQKDLKSADSSNPLYDFIQSENTNGHGDEVLTNGGGDDEDLLGNSTGNSGDLLGNYEGNTEDLIGNYEGNTEDLLGNTGDNSVDLLGDSGDLLPVTSDDSGVTVDTNNWSETQAGEVTQERSRTNSETSETEEQEQGQAEQNPEPVETQEVSDQDRGPIEPEGAAENEAEDKVEETEALREGTNDVEGDTPDLAQEEKTAPTEPVESADEEVANEVSENAEPEPQLVADDTDQFDDAEAQELEQEEVIKAESEEQTETTPAQEEDSATEIQPEPEAEVIEEQAETVEQAPVKDVQETEPEVVEQPAEPENLESVDEEQQDEPEVIEQNSELVAEEEPTEAKLAKPDSEPAVEEQQDEPEVTEEDSEPVADKQPTEANVAEPDSVSAVEEQEPETDVQEPVSESVVEEQPTELESVGEISTETEPVVEEQPEPEPIVEEQPEPEPIVEEQPEPEPIVEEQPEPEPVVEEQLEPEPEVKEQLEPKPVVEEQPEPEPVVEEEQPEPEPVVEEQPEPEQVVEEQPVEPEIIESVTEPIVEEQQVREPSPEPVVEEQPAELETPESVAEELAEASVTDAAPDTVDESVEKPAELVEDVQTTEQTTEEETRPSGEEENGVKVNGTGDANENGVTEEEAVRDPNITRETREKEEVHFAELNNFRQKFESGTVSDHEPTPRKASVRDEYDQAGGEYESTPVQNPDVVRETDHQGEELPEVGSAKNLASKFKSMSEEGGKYSKRVSPPREIGGKVEYESQPTERQEQFQGKSDEGVFESTPQDHENVVKSGGLQEDVKPEQGSTKNIMNKFKEIQTAKDTTVSEKRREITPDRSGKVEYVSEPRGQRIEYAEAESESGVFESTPTGEEGVVRSGDRAEEVLPETGTAKNLLSKFKQMESEAGNKAPPSPKREITPDRSGKVEYVSEPRGFLEKYEQREDAGVFESQPVVHEEVVRSGDMTDDIKPEAGSAKKAMDMFKEIQKQSTSPVHKSGKEFTPPRETSPGKTVAGVVENTPEERPDVVRSGDAIKDELPGQGSARNILNKFKEIQSGSGSTSPTKQKKEFTPPPESGVYENTPSEHLVIETKQSESGIVENTPARSTADVARERESVTPESEIPESGMAKNLVSKFRQLESSAKTSTSPSPSKYKEFTPPRDSHGPLSPKSPAGATTNSVHPSDLPGQYQPQDQPGIFENEPEVKSDIVREADTDWTDGMPKANTTSSMLEKFKSMQQKAEEEQHTPPPVSRKEKGMFRVVQTEKCAACQKTVYAMEKLEMNGHIYHRNCFKCSHCSARLTPKTFSMNEGVIYCTNHFKQLFARKGNYDEGFGRQQYKKKWGGDKQEGATATS